MSSDRTGRRRHAPASLSDVLADTRRTTQARSGRALDRTTWRHAVGRRIAERTEVGPLRGDELTIFVASAAWSQELSLLSAEILERLNAHGVTATRLRFRVRTDLAAEKPAPKAKRLAQPRPLPAEIATRLAHVQDDELRRAIAEAAGLALSRTEAPRPTSKKPVARTPPAAGARTAPQGRSSPATPAAGRGKPAKS